MAIQSDPVQGLEQLRASPAVADVALYNVLSHPEAIAQHAESLAAAIGPANFQALAAAADSLKTLAAQNDEVKGLLASGGDPAAALEDFKTHFDGAASIAGAVPVPAGFSEAKPRGSGLEPAAPNHPTEPRVVVAADSDVNQALAVFGKKPVDLAALPSMVRPRLERLVRESGGLLDSLLKPEDGPGKVHVVLLDDMKPTAVTTYLGNGERVIGLNLGIFNVIENDAELAYIFAQQLEHSNSQLADKAAELKAKGMIQGDFLDRTSSNEVDVRAVLRLVDNGMSPHAAVDYLNRLRSKVGEVFEPRTSSLLTTRVSVVGSAIALLVRGKGGNEEHRLDSLPRPRKVVEGAAESLRSDPFREHLAARVETLLQADGAGESLYEEVKEGVFFGVGAALGDPRGNAFARDYHRIWREIEALRLEPIPARRAIDLQMKLIKNLDAAYARSRAKVLGSTFHAENAHQIRSLLEAEKRSYSLSAPNLFGAAHELFEVETELKDLEARALKPGDADYETRQREMQLVRQRRSEARDQYDLATYPYEADAGLEDKLRAIYAKGDRRLYDWSHDDEWGDSHQGGRTLDELKLRLREIHGLFTGERERLKEVKRAVREPKLDPDQPLYSFLTNGINPVDRGDHTVEEYKEIFDVLKTVLKREFGPGGEAQARVPNLKYLTDSKTGGMLRAFFWRYHALEPADADARLHEAFDLLAELDWKPEQLAGLKEYLDEFDRLLTPAAKESISSKIQLKSVEGMAEEVKSANTVDEVFVFARKLRESVHDDRSFRGRGGIRLPAAARLKLLDALTERLATASGLGTARAKSLIKIMVPSWDPLESTCRHASLSIL